MQFRESICVGVNIQYSYMRCHTVAKIEGKAHTQIARI